MSDAEKNERMSKMKNKTETLEEWLAKGNKIKICAFNYGIRKWSGKFFKNKKRNTQKR